MVARSISSLDPSVNSIIKLRSVPVCKALHIYNIYIHNALHAAAESFLVVVHETPCFVTFWQVSEPAVPAAAMNHTYVPTHLNELQLTCSCKS